MKYQDNKCIKMYQCNTYMKRYKKYHISKISFAFSLQNPPLIQLAVLYGLCHEEHLYTVLLQLTFPEEHWGSPLDRWPRLTDPNPSASSRSQRNRHHRSAGSAAQPPRSQRCWTQPSPKQSITRTNLRGSQSIATERWIYQLYFVGNLQAGFLPPFVCARG